MNNKNMKKSNSKGKLNDITLKPSIFSSIRIPTFNKSKLSSKRSSDLKMDGLLNHNLPTPEDVSLTTGTVKKKKKSFEIFRKYIKYYSNKYF